MLVIPIHYYWLFPSASCLVVWPKIADSLQFQQHHTWNLRVAPADLEIPSQKQTLAAILIQSLT
jgi:hypothetical protein